MGFIKDLISGAPSPPKPLPPPPPAQAPVLNIANDAKRKGAIAAAAGSTQATPAGGLTTPASTAQKQLTG